MVYMTIYWTSDDCHGQANLTLNLSVGQVILFTYFDHCLGVTINANMKVSEQCRIAACKGNQILRMIRRNIT